jgi:hypothetical protein
MNLAFLSTMPPELARSLARPEGRHFVASSDFFERIHLTVNSY